MEIYIEVTLLKLLPFIVSITHSDTVCPWYQVLYIISNPSKNPTEGSYVHFADKKIDCFRATVTPSFLIHLFTK